MFGTLDGSDLGFLTQAEQSVTLGWHSILFSSIHHDDEKPNPKPEEEKKAPRPVRVPRKIGEPPGNLSKRQRWFRKRSGG